MTLHFDTRLIQRSDVGAGTGATAPPLVQNTAFSHERAEDIEAIFSDRAPGFIYTRIGNPTLFSLERQMAALEGGIGAQSFASGMAAITATALTLAAAGDNIVSARGIFGGTVSLLGRTLGRCGIETRFVDAGDPEAIAGAIDGRTRMILVETIGNPRMNVPDLRAVADVADEHGVVFVADSTATTPALLRPGEFGAHLVIHSLSKFVNGQGTAIGGVVVDCNNFDWASERYRHLRDSRDRAGEFAFLGTLRTQVARDLGGCLSPFNAWLLLLGLETLAIRMERHCASALRVAAALQGEPDLPEVRYPGLETHPDVSRVRTQFGGKGGGLMTLRLGDRDRAFRFLNGLKLARNLANLGDARTLVIHPASTICRSMSEEERREQGVTDDLVRISIGLEHSDDILKDLKDSLKSL